MAAIIKAGQIRDGADSARCIEFNLTDMSQGASDYLDNVKQQAEQIINQARQQANQIKEQAKLAGKQEAIQAAKREAVASTQANWKTLGPALQQAIDSFRQLQQQWLCEWEENVVELAITIAERIVRQELQTRPEISHHWLRDALELATKNGSMRIYINPQDYEALGDQVTTIAQELGQLTPTEVIADPEVTAGGCRVATDHGYIDQQLQNQLARIKSELLM
jgi:flagellar assembly protein FliH